MSIQRRPDGRYRLRWLDGGQPPAGTYRQRTLPPGTTYDEARAEERILRGRAAGRAHPPSKLTFGELAKLYVSEELPQLAPRWGKQVEALLTKRFTPRWGKRRAADLTARDLSAYRRERIAEGIAPATANRETAVLLSILAYGVREDLLEAHPIPRGKLRLPGERPRRIVYTPGEWRAIVGAFDDPVAWRAYMKTVHRLGPVVADARTGEGRRYGGTVRPDSPAAEKFRQRRRAAMLFVRGLLLTASRLGELLALRWRDVDRKAGTVRFTLEKTRRSGVAEKVLPISSGLAELLDELPRAVGDAPVFTVPGGGAWDAKRIHVAFKQALLHGRLPDGRRIPEDRRLHDLRHLAATLLAEGGFPEGIAAEVLGHSRRTTTAGYTHPRPDSLLPALEVLATWDREARNCGKARSGDAKRDAGRRTGVRR